MPGSREAEIQRRAERTASRQAGVSKHYPIKRCQSQWSKLERFLLNGRLEIDHNRNERSIKLFTIARKASLFCNTPKVAQANAVVHSVAETAKENALVPFEYLRYLFERLPNLGDGDLDELLPWSDSVLNYCRVSQ